MRAIALALLIVPVTSSAGVPIVADATNRVLGFYTGPQVVVAIGPTIVVTSSKGFRAAFDIDAGTMMSEAVDPWAVVGATVDSLYFQSSDCSGAAHMPALDPRFRGGVVARQSGSGLIYFVPKNAAAATFAAGSRSTNGACKSGDFGNGPFNPVLPNDATVTGFDSSPAQGPLTLEVAEILGSSFDLFRNGFEGAMVDSTTLTSLA